MKGYEEVEAIDYRIIPGCTPDYVVSELTEIPLVYKHWKKNNQENQKSLIDAFMRLPTKADGPGFIYGFRERNSYNSADRSYWIKMGRTKREVPQDRIFQWEKADKHTYNQVFTLRSQYNSKLQLLVHLIFAYARKPIKINDNLRIQWFQFHEKVPTAAITNLTNLLMEKIHQKFINKIEELNQQVFPAYDNILQKLLRKEQFTINKFTIVAFGLPKTGKSLFQSIISDDQMIAEKGERGLKVIFKSAQKKREKNYIEITDFQNLTNPEEIFEQYFTTWHKLCSSKAILPLLFVKQSDLESSKLLGLTQGLSLLEKYVINKNRVIIVVTHARQNFTVEEAKQYIEDNKEFLTKAQLKCLLQSQYIIVKGPQKAGVFPTKSEKEAISKILSAERMKILENSGISDCTLQFKMEKQYLKICHQIIQKSYLILQPIYASKFLARYHEYLQDDLRDIFVQNIHDFIDKLKQQDQGQQSLHALIKQCSSLLELSPQEQLQSFLYIFCEFCSNKTMRYSEITSLLSEKVNERIVSINQNYISIIDASLESYSNAISSYLSKKQDQFVDPLMKVMSQSSVSNMIKILQTIIEEGKRKPKPQSSLFVKDTEKIVKALSFIEEKINKGFRLDSVLGKIRQAIYYGLKGEPKQIEEIKVVEPFEEVTEAENEDSSTSIEDCMKEQIGSLSQLHNKIDNYPQGSTVLNVVRQFVIDSPPKRYSIKHNIFILAKEIKAYNGCDISFKTVYKGEEKKLKLMLMSQKFTNYSKINIPSGSRNGIAFVLNIVNKEIIPLKPQVKPQVYNKNIDAIAVLKRIYDSKLA